MRILHVRVSRGEEYLIGQGLEEPGVLSQGRTLDELVANVRDAAQLLLGVKEVYLELTVPADVEVGRGKATAARSRRASA